MVLISTSDPTLDAVRKAYADKSVNEKRSYLGASLIGQPCARRIWYTYNGYEAEEFSVKTLWNFESGHRAEDIWAERLRLVPGIILHTKNPKGEQYGFADMEDKFKGHYDGIILGLLQAPKTVHLWEHKDCNEKKFAEFKKCKSKYGEKHALAQWNEVYYAQAQVNMHYSKTTRHYTTVSVGVCRDVDSCRTEYDEVAAERFIEKARRIIEAKEPPMRISNFKDYYLCKFCNYSETCHKRD